MKLEKQVASLELSKKLEELGVEQNSLFGWSLYDEKNNLWGVEEFRNIGDEYSAFTVAELGEMLPVTIQMNRRRGVDTHWLENTKTTHKYRCGYIYEDSSGTTGWGRVSDFESHAVGISKTEANARAKMLIYLLENKLITNDTTRT